ncbi:MAG TPA: hypothetical protein VKQ34_04275 [Candidatus Saccharimonadales bacterium]|nr:hypothetical protein [Candidatus Saccharimonadales bacterium]
MEQKPNQPGTTAEPLLSTRERLALHGREYARRSRVGIFLYLTLADWGVRTAAIAASRLEPGPNRRQAAFRRMIDNWRSARQQMERGIGLWG